MNYENYRFTVSELLILIGKAILLNAIIAYVFYCSLWGFLLFPVVFGMFFLQEKKRKKEERKRKLHKDFLEGLKLVSANLLAGYSMENAWREMEKEFATLYADTSIFYLEVKEINRLVEMNIPIENLVYDFAYRTGINDLIHFAQIMQYVKRSGGNWKKIIDETIFRMEEKYEIENQIEVLIAGKRFEQKIMNVVPLFMICFLQITAKDYMNSLYGNIKGVFYMSLCLMGYIMTVLFANKIVQIQV